MKRVFSGSSIMRTFLGAVVSLSILAACKPDAKEVMKVPEYPEEGFAKVVTLDPKPNMDAALFTQGETDAEKLRFGKIDLSVATIRHQKPVVEETVVVDWGQPDVYKAMRKGLLIHYMMTGQVARAKMDEQSGEKNYRVVKVTLPQDVNTVNPVQTKIIEIPAKKKNASPAPQKGQ